MHLIDLDSTPRHLSRLTLYCAVHCIIYDTNIVYNVISVKLDNNGLTALHTDNVPCDLFLLDDEFMVRKMRKYVYIYIYMYMYI